MEDKIKEMLDQYTKLFKEALEGIDEKFKSQEEKINSKLDLHKADTEKLFIENFNKKQEETKQENKEQTQDNNDLEDF